MRESLPQDMEKNRVTEGPMASDASYGLAGAFEIIMPKGSLIIIASDGEGWEHVSVHFHKNNGKKRCPTWGEMCYVKSLFWNPDETVIQYHPAQKEYINCHQYVLHMWKPIGIELPKPPKWMVGPS